MVRPTTRKGSESFWGRCPQCRERTVGERRKRSGRGTSPGRKEIWRDWWTGVGCLFCHFQSHFWIERPCWLWSPAPAAPSACPRLPSAEKATFSAGRWFLSHIHFFCICQPRSKFYQGVLVCQSENMSTLQAGENSTEIFQPHIDWNRQWWMRPTLPWTGWWAWWPCPAPTRAAPSSSTSTRWRPTWRRVNSGYRLVQTRRGGAKWHCQQRLIFVNVHHTPHYI